MLPTSTIVQPPAAAVAAPSTPDEKVFVIHR